MRFVCIFRSSAILALGWLLLSPITDSGAANFTNPVIPGDYPDPSVIRVGKDYYATATTSEWAPLFPILHSTDLVNWKHVGNVFQKRPEWSVGNYWAPEIAEHNGKFFIYYVARKKGGPLHLAVAAATRPEGPYTDHGPMIGQPAGSIDAFPATNRDGIRYLIWKEDGNSRNLPTPLWIQRLSEDGTKLVGEMKEILRNDAPWEGRVVEGACLVTHGEFFYLFYAGNACCGRGCSYGVGVARARDLLGPWEKCPRNPIISDNPIWKCPGHGTIVSDGKGHDYFMYHAYHAQDFVYVGRQAVLDRIDWNADGWPEINEGKGVSFSSPAPHGIETQHSQFEFSDEFTGLNLGPEWQWPQHLEPRWKLDTSDGGVLQLQPNPARAQDRAGGVLALKTTSGHYEARTSILLKHLPANASAGLSAYGDHENALGLSVGNGSISIWRRIRNKDEQLHTSAAPSAEKLHIKLTAVSGARFRYAISSDGQSWQQIGPEMGLEGEFLPPWDRGIRVALTCGGGPDVAAKFDFLRIQSTPPKLSN